MQRPNKRSKVQSVPIKLTWRRFKKLTEARDAFRKEPCIYITADNLGNAIRIGLASKGLEPRYRGGTGYAIDAAMHNSGNLIFVASVAAEMCQKIEAELIWRGRSVLTYNNAGKVKPPAVRVHLVHRGKAPGFDGFERRKHKERP